MDTRERNPETRKETIMETSSKIRTDDGEVSGRACDCCGRHHRKLFSYSGAWLGKTCLQSMKLYRMVSSPTNIAWIGWERQYARVKDLAARLGIA
jgi:hypothetical protein